MIHRGPLQPPDPGGRLYLKSPTVPYTWARLCCCCCNLIPATWAGLLSLSFCSPDYAIVLKVGRSQGTRKQGGEWWQKWYQQGQMGKPRAKQMGPQEWGLLFTSPYNLLTHSCWLQSASPGPNVVPQWFPNLDLQSVLCLELQIHLPRCFWVSSKTADSHTQICALLLALKSDPLHLLPISMKCVILVLQVGIVSSLTPPISSLVPNHSPSPASFISYISDLCTSCCLCHNHSSSNFLSAAHIWIIFIRIPTGLVALVLPNI